MRIWPKNFIAVGEYAKIMSGYAPVGSEGRRRGCASATACSPSPEIKRVGRRYQEAIVAEGKRKYVVAPMAGGGEGGRRCPPVAFAAAGRLPEGGWAGNSGRAERLTCSRLLAGSLPPPPDPGRSLPAKTQQQGPPLTYLNRQLKRHSNCYYIR